MTADTTRIRFRTRILAAVFAAGAVVGLPAAAHATDRVGAVALTNPVVRPPLGVDVWEHAYSLRSTG